VIGMRMLHQVLLLLSVSSVLLMCLGIRGGGKTHGKDGAQRQLEFFWGDRNQKVVNIGSMPAERAAAISPVIGAKLKNADFSTLRVVIILLSALKISLKKVRATL